MEATEGNWSRVEMLARDLLSVQANHRTAHAFLGVASFKAGDYPPPTSISSWPAPIPIGELTSTLARAWVYRRRARPPRHWRCWMRRGSPTGRNTTCATTRALLADQAAAASRPAPPTSASQERPAHAAHLARLRAPRRQRRRSQARAEHPQGPFRPAKADGHPGGACAEAQIKGGATPEVLVTTPAQGLAEVFYGLGEALSRREGHQRRLHLSADALYVVPGFSVRTGDAGQHVRDTKRYDTPLRLRPIPRTRRCSRASTSARRST